MSDLGADSLFTTTSHTCDNGIDLPPTRAGWVYIASSTWGGRFINLGGPMRRLTIAAIAAVCTIALTQIASAADLPRKAPAYSPPPPVFSWTGCYIGGNIGYGWGRDTVTISDLGATTGVPELAGVPFGPVTGDTKGVVGGGQVGCNYQFASNWVIGIEGDGEAADIRGGDSIFLVCEPDRPHNSHRDGACPDRLDCQRHRSARLDVGSRDALCQGWRGMGG